MIASLLAVMAFSTNAATAKSQALDHRLTTKPGSYVASDAQESIYKLSPDKGVVMNLSGTTPVKDWTMSAHGIQGDARMIATRDNQLLDIKGLSFILPVTNLKGEGRGMDNDAYVALKVDRYKDIVFKLSSATVQPLADHLYAVAANGTLSVAGVTRNVTLRMHGHADRDGTITFSGSENVKMSDYNVERPSVLFGVIKADDNMTLTYNLIFTK